MIWQHSSSPRPTSRNYRLSLKYFLKSWFWNLKKKLFAWNCPKPVSVSVTLLLYIYKDDWLEQELELSVGDGSYTYSSTHSLTPQLNETTTMKVGNGLLIWIRDFWYGSYPYLKLRSGSIFFLNIGSLIILKKRIKHLLRALLFYERVCPCLSIGCKHNAYFLISGPTMEIRIRTAWSYQSRIWNPNDKTSLYCMSRKS